MISSSPPTLGQVPWFVRNSAGAAAEPGSRRRCRSADRPQQRRRVVDRVALQDRWAAARGRSRRSYARRAADVRSFDCFGVVLAFADMRLAREAPRQPTPSSSEPGERERRRAKPRIEPRWIAAPVDVAELQIAPRNFDGRREDETHAAARRRRDPQDSPRRHRERPEARLIGPIAERADRPGRVDRHPDASCHHHQGEHRPVMLSATRRRTRPWYAQITDVIASAKASQGIVIVACISRRPRATPPRSESPSSRSIVKHHSSITMMRMNGPHEGHPQRRDEQVLNDREQLRRAQSEQACVDVHVDAEVAGRRRRCRRSPTFRSCAGSRDESDGPPGAPAQSGLPSPLLTSGSVSASGEPPACGSSPPDMPAEPRPSSGGFPGARADRRLTRARRGRG